MEYENKAILAGEIDRIDLRYTKSGTAVLGGTLKVEREFNGKTTEWYHSYVVWGEKAQEFSDTVEKGDNVRITGELVINIWEDRDNIARRDHKVEVKTFELLQGRKQSEDEDSLDDEMDDVPF